MNRLHSVLLGMVLLLSGCITTHFETPKLTIVDVSMISADVFSQQFRIRLQVINPNNRELPIQGIEYQLSLQGNAFAEGVSEQPFVVPANGQAQFDTLVTTHMVSSLGRMLDGLRLAGNGKLQYAFVGSVRLSKGLLRKLPFNEQGVVELGAKQ